MTMDAALQRLDKALGALEASVEMCAEADNSLTGLQEDLQRLNDDRSQLASELDKSVARAERLETVNRDVSRRLVSAMETIRNVLEARGT